MIMEESINSGINGLSEEILEGILARISTTDLLHSGRLVSERWKRISTSLCRQRFVELTHLTRGEQTVFNVFPNSVDITWSSFTYSIHNEKPTTNFAYEQLILEAFGNRFWKLTLIDLGISGSLLHILRFTPNLRSLKLRAPGIFATKQVAKVHLPSLKTLKMQITDTSINLFEFLVRSCSAQLDKVKLRILIGISVETAVKLSSLLTSIPNIVLKVYQTRDVGPEALTAIADGKLKLRKLNVTFEEPPRRDPAYFSPIEAILTHSAEMLRSLKFFCHYIDGRSKTPLKFPILPVLKVLKVRFDGIEWDESNTFVEHFLSTVTSEHFPVLERVKVHMEFYEFSKFTACLFYRRKQEDRCRFPTVKQLEVNTCRLKDNWRQLFPRLLSLTAKVENRSFLCSVFTRLLTLEHLNLSFNMPELFGFDLNLELSGFDTLPHLSSAFDQEEDEQAGHCEWRRHFHRGPCLLSLTALKTVGLTCEDDRTQLDDSGAVLAFLPLQPLNKLVLRNHSISEDCKFRLVARHHNVEII